jgi:hypothetical protein
MKAFVAYVVFVALSSTAVSVVHAAEPIKATSFSAPSSSGFSPMFEVKRGGKHAARKAKRVAR